MLQCLSIATTYYSNAYLHGNNANATASIVAIFYNATNECVAITIILLQTKKPLQCAIATEILAAAANQPDLVADATYCNYFGHIATFFVIGQKSSSGKYVYTIYFHFVFPYLMYLNIYVRSFDWILVIIQPDRSHVTIFDSLRRPPKYYQDMQDTLGL